MILEIRFLCFVKPKNFIIYLNNNLINFNYQLINFQK